MAASASETLPAGFLFTLTTKDNRGSLQTPEKLAIRLSEPFRYIITEDCSHKVLTIKRYENFKRVQALFNPKHIEPLSPVPEDLIKVVR